MPQVNAGDPDGKSSVDPTDLPVADGGGVTGPVTHLVEQLWAQAVASGQVRLRVGGPPGDLGWQERESYLVLPSMSRATLLVPAGPVTATAGALTNYRGLRRPATNVQRAVLGAAARSRVRLPFPRLSVQAATRTSGSSAVATPVLPLARLAGDLGLPEVLASIGVRTGANRKATLQLVDRDGAPRGFAKMSWGPTSRDGVLAEEAALRSQPATTAAGAPRAPRLLASGEHHGWPYVVIEPLPSSSRGVRAGTPPPTAQELYDLCPLARVDRVSGTEQFRRLRDRVLRLRRAGAEPAVVRAVQDLLQQLEQQAAEIPVTERMHGDLTPWNSARDESGTLWCWDWESSETDAVAGLDPLHWHMTVRSERGEPFDGSTLRQAQRDAEPMLVAAGAARRTSPIVTALYAATIAERACAWAVGGGGWDEGWVTPQRMLDLLSAAREPLGGPAT